MDTSTLSKAVRAIVVQQKTIIGPMAVDQANKVSGVHVSSDLSSIEVSGSASQVLADLVKQYERLFGKASVEACKDSIREANVSIPAKDMPQILQ